MKKIAIILICILGTVISTNAQHYRTGIGLRAGSASGLTVKNFINKHSAIEGILSTRWGGFLITGLYEMEYGLSTPGLDWYFGAGAHIGFWDNNNKAGWMDPADGSYTIVGFDGILGIEYTLADAPLNISLDWKPALNLIGYSGLWADMFAVSLRFAIK